MRHSAGALFGRISAWVALALPALLGPVAEPEGACPAHLFVIARSKNANVVAYDAKRTPTGDIAASEPVAVYWLLGGDAGKREELNLVERNRAYGVDVTPGETPGTFAMTFKASRKRSFSIHMLHGCAVTTTSIGGRDGVLRRMFVQSKEGSLPKIDYVELFGDDPATGDSLYEKFVPSP